MNMRITVIGSGYVGLVAGACLADVGNRVTCADVDENKVKTLSNGEVPFYEPRLPEIVSRNIKAGRLKFTTDVEKACRSGAVIFIAVGTPQGDDGSAELKFVEKVAKPSVKHWLKAKICWLRDTGHSHQVHGSVGTTDKISTHRKEANVPYVVFQPEFLKEGDAVNDFRKPTESLSVHLIRQVRWVVGYCGSCMNRQELETECSLCAFAQ